MIKSTLRKLKSLFVVSARSLNTKDYLSENSDLLEFLSPDFYKNPYPYYESLRQKSPVQYMQKQNYWLVLNYADVDFALKNPNIFSSNPAKGLDAILLGAEPVDHGRSRKLLAPFFKNASISSFSSFIKNTAKTLIEDIKHQHFDIVNDYAIPLTEKVICHLIGLNAEEFADIQHKIGPDKYELYYIPALESFFSIYLEKHKSKSTGSLCSVLLDDDREKGFTIDELTSIFKLLWVAGTTTTSMLISSSVLILLSQPEILKGLVTDISGLPLFIEEVLRFESPEQTSWRTTMADVAIAGITIPANAEVRLCLAAANRDSLVFESPDKFKTDRNPKKHLAFAAGHHYCLGAELARLEARIAIETFIGLCPATRLKTSPDKLNYLHSDHFRALKHLIVGTE